MRRFSVPVLSPAKRVIYVFVALSGAGWVFVEVAPEVARNILAERWTPEYWALAPFFHGALWHFLLNAMALNFLGEPMLRALGSDGSSRCLRSESSPGTWRIISLRNLRPSESAQGCWESSRQ